jgi:hypothetical protein
MNPVNDNVAVDAKNPEYETMCSAWELQDALLGGAAVMREGGTKWLPKEELEKWDRYSVRLQNSTLFGRFKAAVTTLKTRPFAKPVQIRNAEQLPEPLAGLAGGVDDEGRGLTAFCEHCMEIAVTRGMVHLLVDYPSEIASNLAEERALGLRPMILAIDPKDLFAWQYIKARNGKKTLTQIRIRETVTESDGGFGFETKERIRVICAGPAGETYVLGAPDGVMPQAHWELWEKVKGAEGKESWVIVGQGPWTIGKITLVTVYLNKTGFMTAQCPLEDLAQLNLHHYQLASDHRNNLRFAMAKVLFGRGLSHDEQNRPIVLGVHEAFLCGSPNADLKVVSDDGQAIAAGESALRHTEEQMDAVAKGPLMAQASGGQTATGKAIDEGKGQCELQAWVHLLEDGMDQALAHCFEWIGLEKPDEVGVDISDDFEVMGRSGEDLDYLDRARSRGDIDHITYLDGLKLRGVLRETADIEKIAEQARAEGPSTGMIGREGVE